MMNVDLAGHHGRFLSFDVGARATKWVHQPSDFNYCTHAQPKEI
jgi:hypothetical protein